MSIRAAFLPASLLIDGEVVQTTDNLGDPGGTSYVVLFGVKEVGAGSHSVNISAPSKFNGGGQRIMILAQRTAF